MAQHGEGAIVVTNGTFPQRLDWLGYHETRGGEDHCVPVEHGVRAVRRVPGLGVIETRAALRDRAILVFVGPRVLVRMRSALGAGARCAHFTVEVHDVAVVDVRSRVVPDLVQHRKRHGADEHDDGE